MLCNICSLVHLFPNAEWQQAQAPRRFILNNPVFTAIKDPEIDRLSETRDGCSVYHRHHVHSCMGLCEGEQPLLTQLLLSQLVCTGSLRPFGGSSRTCLCELSCSCSPVSHQSLEAPVFTGWFPALTACSESVCSWVSRLSVSRCATICSIFGISHILVKFVEVSRLSGSSLGLFGQRARPSEFGDVPEMAKVSCKPCPLCQSSLPVFACLLSVNSHRRVRIQPRCHPSRILSILFSCIHEAS